MKKLILSLGLLTATSSFADVACNKLDVEGIWTQAYASRILVFPDRMEQILVHQNGCEIQFKMTQGGNKGSIWTLDLSGISERYAPAETIKYNTQIGNKNEAMGLSTLAYRSSNTIIDEKENIISDLDLRSSIHGTTYFNGIAKLDLKTKVVFSKDPKTGKYNKISLRGLTPSLLDVTETSESAVGQSKKAFVAGANYAFQLIGKYLNINSVEQEFLVRHPFDKK